jgi:hypothetical protein
VKNLAVSGKFSFIVPDSYPTADYAEPSRQMLLGNCIIEHLTFIPGIKLFTGADVYNFIFSVTKDVLPLRRQIKRTKIVEIKEEIANMGHSISHFKTIELKPLSQRRWGDKVFRIDFEGQEDLSDVIELGELCYISKGMVLNADEKHHKGEFTKDNLISPYKDKIHSKPYVEGKDIRRFYVNNERWLEWDTERMPSKVSRPMFPEIYENEKIIAGQTSGAIYDDGRLFSDCSTMLIIPYFKLIDAYNKAKEIKDGKIESNFSYRNLLKKDIAARIEAGVGKELNLKYLLALINSKSLGSFFEKNIASADTRCLYPDDWRKFPIKIISPAEQMIFAGLIDEIMRLKVVARKKMSLKSLLEEKDSLTTDLIGASFFVKTNIDNNFSLSTCLLGEDRLILKKSPLYYLESSSQDVLKYLHLFISENMAELKNLNSSDFMKHVRLPKIPLKITEFLEFYTQAKNELELKKIRTAEIEAEIDELVARLYGLNDNGANGKLYSVEDAPKTAQHMIIKKSMEVGEIQKSCFKLDGMWVLRSVNRIPPYVTIAWWDGKWHEGECFIKEGPDAPIAS